MLRADVKPDWPFFVYGPPGRPFAAMMKRDGPECRDVLNPITSVRACVGRHPETRGRELISAQSKAGYDEHGPKCMMRRGGFKPGASPFKLPSPSVFLLLDPP